MLGGVGLVFLEQHEAFEDEGVHVGGAEAAVGVFVVEDDGVAGGMPSLRRRSSSIRTATT